MEEPKPRVIVLLGPPGAGKGTHAGPLSNRLGLPHISTGDLFREQIRSRTPLGTIAAQFIGEGKLVPDPLVLDMLIGRVQRPDCAQGYILDGFPRTVAQAQAFDQRVASSCRLVVFYLEVGDEMLIERIGARIGCNRCGIPYHLRFAPPRSPGVCDECHGPLLQREDDRPDIVRKRLEVYHTQTQPLIEYYQSQGGIFCRIDGAQSKQQVQSDLVAALSSETVLR